jgi:putative secretion ATPase (PEP-CTERM system associated)
MYERYYNFTGSPFQLTPDTRFFYGSRGHSRAIAHLTFGLAQDEGFIIVTGEVGAGKTTLIERLVSQLDRDTYVVARINTTQVSSNDLFRLALAGFGVSGVGVEGEEASKSTLLLRFEEALREHRLAGRRCLLIVDEVQNLTLPALEELRMLSNITEGGRASLQTILMGQPQFRRMLASPDLDQLRQRVLASYHLGPLTREETRAYVEHRLSTVGWCGNPLWKDPAFAAVHDHTGGIPRRINRLCGRVLLYGALERADTITAAIVVDTAEELAKDLEGTLAAQGAAAANGGPRDTSDLLHRIETLEAQMTRRERMFLRLIDVLSNRRAP